MLYETVTDEPRIASKDYATAFSEPLIPSENNDWLGMIFQGSGISIDEHPLKGRTNMYGCGGCKSENVLVIYGQWSVSTHSGDAYWDYEIVCGDCGKFTARSFSDND